MNTEYTCVVYQSPKISTGEKDGYIYIMAKENISFGEIIMVEHVLTAPTNVCHLIINYNEYLFDSYHPRTVKFKDATADERHLMTKEKICHNCFGVGENLLILSHQITKLNHSCTPNCVVFIRHHYKGDDTRIVFMELYCIRDIKEGSEVMISYGPETSHKRDFECGCGKELVERTKMFNVISALAKVLSDKSKLQIEEKIYYYLQMAVSKKVLMNQFLSTKGVFMNKDQVAIFTTEGEKVINEIISKNSKIKSGDGMNNAKIGIFLRILNACLD